MACRKPLMPRTNSPRARRAAASSWSSSAEGPFPALIIAVSSSAQTVMQDDRHGKLFLVRQMPREEGLDRQGCEYCTMGHTYLSRAAGMDEATVAALRAGEAPADPRLAVLFAFTRTVVESRGHAGDDAVALFLTAGYTKENLLEVVTAIATKTISNYANHLTATPREEFMADPALAWTAPAVRAAAE
jgi:hypothetical protein